MPGTSPRFEYNFPPPLHAKPECPAFELTTKHSMRNQANPSPLKKHCSWENWPMVTFEFLQDCYVIFNLLLQTTREHLVFEVKGLIRLIGLE